VRLPATLRECLNSAIIKRRETNRFHNLYLPHFPAVWINQKAEKSAAYMVVPTFSERIIGPNQLHRINHPRRFMVIVLVPKMSHPVHVYGTSVWNWRRSAGKC
jgi:hypothetical protein